MNESRIEEELRKALRREQPPQGFAERVLARVRTDAAPTGFWQSLFALIRIPKYSTAVAIAMVLVIVGVTWEYRRYEREREAGEAARRQLLLALHITGSKLHFAEQRLNQAGSRHFGPMANSEESQ